MKNNVTIIPSDKFISINGVGYIFEFGADVDIHAIQWHDGSFKQVEYNDGKPPLQLTSTADYDTHVAPFVALWEAERDRIETEKNRQPTPEEQRQTRIAEIKSRLLEIDLESVRPLRAKAYGTATPEDDAKLAALEQETGALRVERAGLSDE